MPGIANKDRQYANWSRLLRTSGLAWLFLLLLVAWLTLDSAQAQADELPAEPEVGLALGSGGAGGLAHIAMLEVLDAHEVRPVKLTGTSIGALIGVLYADGLSAADIYDIFDDFGGSGLDALSGLWSSGISMQDIMRLDLNNGGLVNPDAFLDFLLKHMSAEKFSELAIPFQVVATDYWTGDMVVLSEGPLKPALQASMAVPGLFSPVEREDRLLIDGGTTNPLPYDLLEGQADFVVAVDVSGARERQANEQPDASELLFSTFEIMQQSIIRARRAQSEPHVFLKPDTSDIRLLHFHKIEQIMTQAEPTAEEFRKALTEYLARFAND